MSERMSVRLIVTNDTPERMARRRQLGDVIERWFWNHADSSDGGYAATPYDALSFLVEDIMDTEKQP